VGAAGRPGWSDVIRAELRAMFYLTTAIDYANGDPHSVTRSKRLAPTRSARTTDARRRMCTSSSDDEHGQKVAQAAAAEGVSPQTLVDRVAERFQAMWEQLGISYDTIHPDHGTGARGRRTRPDRADLRTQSGRLLREVVYGTLLCRLREAFKTDSEIVNGQCSWHPTARWSGWRAELVFSL